ncbi:hypothetical protein FIBSPDRAFT_439539 [Athelia psychrophila]|uniref:Uncharacterized protein n=1 Tax=Athelia psychrophila TaxID=1759441 RepID=A0A166VTD7_9AGAM|nr:hypothetical protein FIBSPDRAFT_439539 [Fibularhizoctonia sp. CBS 109695]
MQLPCLVVTCAIALGSRPRGGKRTNSGHGRLLNSPRSSQIFHWFMSLFRGAMYLRYVSGRFTNAHEVLLNRLGTRVS